jgi:hypothetical protein
MEHPRPAIRVTLRIPGIWESPSALWDALPSGHQLTPNAFVMPDGTSLELDLVDADDQFVSVFASMCRREPSDEEKAIIENYRVNLCLTGDGGSLAAARKLMQAGSAIIDAGAGGVFVDNSGVAIGGSAWQELTASDDIQALTFAFAGIVGGRKDTFSLGLHVLGFPDIIMRSDQVGENGIHFFEILHYLCETDRQIGDGHILADLNGTRFQVQAETDQQTPAKSPMNNPFGRLRLLSMNEVAERN